MRRKTLKSIAILTGVGILSLFQNNANAQSTTANNFQNSGQTKFLGWKNNFKLFTKTNNITRLRLNHSVTYTVNQVTKSFSGYMGIGPTGYFATHTPLAQ